MSQQSDQTDLRSGLARALDGAFPGDGDHLLAAAAANDAPDEVTQRLARLPIDQTFTSVEEVLAALDEP
jgi:L-aminopeptidase/D-esterase-like protein